MSERQQTINNKRKGGIIVAHLRIIKSIEVGGKVITAYGADCNPMFKVSEIKSAINAKQRIEEMVAHVGQWNKYTASNRTMYVDFEGMKEMAEHLKDEKLDVIIEKVYEVMKELKELEITRIRSMQDHMKELESKVKENPEMSEQYDDELSNLEYSIDKSITKFFEVFGDIK